ncbi:Hpt domain-containing protein [Duganella sp. FT3S]|uniref:Hpt domain-containing protein n=1 Tax=Rugamonas fusca TaxID=2758568 RepID=A0A7W2EEF7_9BURK|nr:Hpt domain-containing protein [Rugamonas fusca]MBA5604272.1 Hpt domain-containing protein [Rugamonas fusca]
MYRQMLRRLCREQVAFDIDFSGARVAADTATTRRIAHTLRGLAGTIGALQVQMAAAALEHACLRNEPDNELDALQAQVTAELDTVLAGLAPLDLEPELAPALPALDGPTLQAGLARLRELLDDNGGAALKLAARLSREARGSPAEALLSTIAAAAEDYDFEQALRTLQEVESAV